MAYGRQVRMCVIELVKLKYERESSHVFPAWFTVHPKIHLSSGPGGVVYILPTSKYLQGGRKSATT